MEHEEFAELYRFHAGSHLYNGFELLWGLVLLMTLGDWSRTLPGGAVDPVGKYWRTCWSLWAVVVAWLFAPFWFNPLAFDLKKNLTDLRRWWQWMQRKDAAALSAGRRDALCENQSFTASLVRPTHWSMCTGASSSSRRSCGC